MKTEYREQGGWQKIHSEKHTCFYILTANFPFVLCDRIELNHLLQINFVGCPRAQRESDRCFPRRDGRVQDGTGWWRVWFPLSFIPHPLPHWLEIHTEENLTLTQWPFRDQKQVFKLLKLCVCNTSSLIFVPWQIPIILK